MADKIVSKGGIASIGDFSVTGSLTVSGSSTSIVEVGGKQFQFKDGGGLDAILSTNYNNFRIRGNNNAGLYINLSGHVSATANMAVGDTYINASAPPARLTVKGSGTTSSTTSLLVENANASASMVVLDDGNVGIGTTTPAYKLDVRGRAYASQSLSVGTTSTAGALTVGGSAIFLAFTEVQNGNNAYFYSSGNTYYSRIRQIDTNLIITPNANVGIGTTSPSAKLHVKGSGTTSATTAFRVENANASGSMVVLDNGNVGIGTTSPTYKLELSGSTASERTIGVDGDPVVYYPDQASSAYDYSVALGNGLRNATNTGGNAGTRNTAIGISNQTNVTTGNGNVSVGSQTLEYNTTGANNITMGHLAGQNIMQNGNTALGFGTMRFVATGSNNVALGYYAGYEDGSSNTITQTINSLYLGSLSKASSTTGNTNEIVIGYQAQGLGSNTVVLGNDSITTTALKGNVGIGTTLPQIKLHISGSTGASSGIRQSRAGVKIWDQQIDSSGRLIWSHYVSEGGTANQLFTLDDSNNVGIGTTSPSAKLHVKGSGTTSSTTAFRVEDANASASLVVNDAGNVLIGTTTDAGYKLDVNGSTRLYGESYVQNGFLVVNGSAPAYSGNALTVYRTNKTVGAIFQDNASTTTVTGNYDNPIVMFNNINTTTNNWTKVYFGSSRTDTASVQAAIGVQNVLHGSSGTNGKGDIAFFTRNTTTFSEKLRITHEGNVGIGTNSPTYALEVSGSGGTQGVIRSRRLIAYGGTAGDPPITTASTIAGLFEVGYAQLGFSSYGGEAGRIETNSRLWNIGMTGGTAKMNIRGTGATSATTAFRVENANTSGSMVILDDGNVGIGTTLPSQKLDVNGNIKASKLLLNTTNDGYTLYSDGESRINGVIFQQVSSTDYLQKASGTGAFYVRNAVNGQNLYVGANNSSGLFTNYLGVDGANNAVAIRTNDVTRLYISSSGNVGIGTTSPSSSLHVSGSTTIDNVLTLTPQDPLPTSPDTGSFAVSASVPPKPYFYDGTSWNALY